jgi:hypothetical protein
MRLDVKLRQIETYNILCGRFSLIRTLCLVISVGFSVMISSTLAYGSAQGGDQVPPHFEKMLKEETVYATRAHIAIEVFPEGDELEWKAEYASSESELGTSKATTDGEGKIEGEGKPVPREVLFLGSESGTVYPHPNALVRDLKPGTVYYARFHAGNEYGKSEATFMFKTTAEEKPEVPDFQVEAASPRSAVAKADIESNGLETTYSFEYAPAEGGRAPVLEGSWKSFSSDTITAAEGYATPEVTLTGLEPETMYYVRVKATNSRGTTISMETNGGGDGSFTTPTAKPVVGPPSVRNVTGTSAHIIGNVESHGLETMWSLQYATSDNGPWLSITEGTISQEQAESLPEGTTVGVEGGLSNLEPSMSYFVRVYARSAAGEAVACHEHECKPISETNFGVSSFMTFGRPSAVTLPVHGLYGETVRVMGGINPDSIPTSGEQTVTVSGGPTGGTFTLSFGGETTLPIAFDAPAEGPTGLKEALDELSSTGGDVTVTGRDGGPYSVYFGGSASGVAQPQMTADTSGLSPSGTVTVSTVQTGGEGYDTHYSFEYVPLKQFEMGGWEGSFTKAVSTPEVDLGSGDSVEYVGVDLPGLVAGESYRFRVVARNTSPGDTVVYGEVESLTVPVIPVVSGVRVGDCPNEALRIGLSARLPDCRAYEQVTPVDKGGAQEIFNYGGNYGDEGALPGEDGDDLEYGSVPVKWGSGPGAGQSPYFFSRTESGWQVTAATVQPGAGIDRYTPQVLSGSLSEFAFESSWYTSPSDSSPNIEFKVGEPGGPYVTAASVPRADGEPGWVAASADFSKLILQVPDHVLLGHSTHTVQGDDLYEYSNGELRQLNVTGGGSGSAIGTCGAVIAGGASGGSINSSVRDSLNVVSGDGSRVFFEAVPGKECSEAEHVYMRMNGGSENAETVDLGAYRFIAANSEGSRVLLEKGAGENPGLYLYDDETGRTEFLPSSGVAVGGSLTVSEDLSTVYIRTGPSNAISLYRYDVDSRELLFVTQIAVDNTRNFYESSPDGRFFYFIAESVAGLPSGGEELQTPGASEKGQTSQVFRYDSSEAVVECMSCASSFDPEPRLSALFSEGRGKTIASANGDYVFFDTPAALVPADVDGEIAPEGLKTEHSSTNYSLSSDVYEWRAVGVDGCLHVQGCLALITSGGGGFLNILLGTTSSGNDVFFSTDESLVSSDNDTSGDIYDARVDGGFPVGSRPVECEGDACSTPFTPPASVTPASATFQGAGNIVEAPAKGKAKTKTKSKECSKKSKKKCDTKPTKKGKAKKAKARAGRGKEHVGGSGGRRK